MKTWNVILGVDVSKRTLDICQPERKLRLHIANNAEGFNEFRKWCKEHQLDLKQTLIVLEYTGGYEYRFLQFCQSKNLSYCRLPGLEIKRSQGMVRGKSDKADAFRIGRYGEDRINRLQASLPLDQDIISLRSALSFRKRLVRENAGYQSSVKERKHMYEVDDKDMIIIICKQKITANQLYIDQLDQQITELLKKQPSMWQNYRILTSIRGIGKVNAWMSIAYTENFSAFADARRYAVYVGVIPFEHTSGTSIRGRRRTSNLARKDLKQELTMAARAAIQHDPEMHDYAERKLKNKAYGIVLNNVKFKLILRMFSLVKRGEMYVDNYLNAA